MNNVEKHILKQDAQNQEDWAKYLQKENEAYKARIKTLEAEITRLNQQIFELQNQETAKPVLQKPTPQPEYTPNIPQTDDESISPVITNIMKRFNLPQGAQNEY